MTQDESAIIHPPKGPSKRSSSNSLGGLFAIGGTMIGSVVVGSTVGNLISTYGYGAIAGALIGGVLGATIIVLDVSRSGR